MKQVYQSSNRNSLDLYTMWFIVKDWSKIIIKDSLISSKRIKEPQYCSILKT